METLTRLLVAVILGLFIVACGPKPQYKTGLGKKKLKYYNSIQYDRAETPKSFKRFKNR